MCLLHSVNAWAADNKPDRRVAITIDDLPAGSNILSAAAITEMTTKLLTTLRDQKVPVVGFVNEKKLYKFGEVDDVYLAQPLLGGQAKAPLVKENNDVREA